MLKKISNFLEIFRTFMPVLLFVIGFLIWVLQQETVSSADFTDLSIRVVVLEQQMPEKEMIQEINTRLASMDTEIKQLSKSMTRIENLMFKKNRN